MKAAKGTVGQEVGHVPALGALLDLGADLVLVAANLTAGPEAEAIANPDLLVGHQCLKRARNGALQVDLSLQHLWIARDPDLGLDLLTVAIELYIICPGDLF